MWESISARAKASGLTLKMRDVQPNSRLAIAAAEWTRRNYPDVADQVREKLFHSHFAAEKDIGDPGILVDVAEECGVDKVAIGSALSDGSAMKFVDEAEHTARDPGIGRTPAWESEGIVLSGLQEAEVWKMAQDEMNGTRTN